MGFVVESIPHTLADPEVGSVRPSTISIVVDFPAPFGPSNPNISPRLFGQVEMIDGCE